MYINITWLLASCNVYTYSHTRVDNTKLTLTLTTLTFWRSNRGISCGGCTKCPVGSITSIDAFDPDTDTVNSRRDLSTDNGSSDPWCAGGRSTDSRLTLRDWSETLTKLRTCQLKIILISKNCFKVELDESLILLHVTKQFKYFKHSKVER